MSSLIYRRLTKRTSLRKQDIFRVKQVLTDAFSNWANDVPTPPPTAPPADQDFKPIFRQDETDATDNRRTTRSMNRSSSPPHIETEMTLLHERPIPLKRH